MAKQKSITDIWPDSGLIYDGARFLSTAARPLEMNASQDAWNWQPVIKDNSVDWLTVYGANQATGTIIVAQGSDIQSTDSNGNPVKYQGSALYRSSNNGLSFQKLPDNAYDKHGGTIISILSGKVTSSAACGN